MSGNFRAAQSTIYILSQGRGETLQPARVGVLGLFPVTCEFAI